MIINQSNLHGLTTGFSAAFNKALSEVSPDYKDIANGTMLNDLNDLIIKYMEENGIDCYSVDSKINVKTGE